MDIEQFYNKYFEAIIYRDPIQRFLRGVARIGLGCGVPFLGLGFAIPFLLYSLIKGFLVFLFILALLCIWVFPAYGVWELLGENLGFSNLHYSLYDYLGIVFFVMVFGQLFFFFKGCYLSMLERKSSFRFLVKGFLYMWTIGTIMVVFWYANPIMWLNVEHGGLYYNIISGLLGIGASFLAIKLFGFNKDDFNLLFERSFDKGYNFVNSYLSNRM